MTKAQHFALRVLRATRQIERLATDRQGALIKALRRDLSLALIEATRPERVHLDQLLSSLERLIRRGRTAASIGATDDVIGAWRLGAESVAAQLSPAQATAAAFGASLSQETATALTRVLHEQMTAVWFELGDRLRVAIRRAVVGLIDPAEAMRAVSRAIKNPKVFGSALVRAEVIVRTEVNRAFEIANQLSALNAAAVGVQVRKAWLAVDDERTRQTHSEAGAIYGIGGTVGPIALAKHFKVGNARLLHPLDPAGPPEETINCRCKAIPIVGAA